MEKYKLTKHDKAVLEHVCDCFNNRQSVSKNTVHTPVSFLLTCVLDKTLKSRVRRQCFKKASLYLYISPCAQCGKVFIQAPGVGPNKKYCSDVCAMAGKKSKRKRYFYDRKVKEYACEICGKIFLSKQSKASFCYKKCVALHRRNLAEQKRVYSVCKKCGKKFFRPKNRPFVDSNTFCSRECAGVGEIGLGKTKKRKSAGSHYHRAKFYGSDFEFFNPFDVFERDNWICQICGKSTPKKNRGSKLHNAPQLDHIVPISKGGPHTYSNTQCLCRDCNLKKSDKI